MRQTSETPTHLNFVDYFKGQQVRISKSKATGELFFNADDVAKVLGFKDGADMAADPEVQAKEIEHKMNTGKSIFIEQESTHHLN